MNSQFMRAAGVVVLLCAAAAVHASHIPGHDDSDPTFPMPIPGPETFTGGVIFVQAIAPEGGTVITNTTFDIHYQSDGVTPASNIEIFLELSVDGSPHNIHVNGADLGFGSGPGLFEGTFTTDAFNGTVDGSPVFPWTIADLEIGSTGGAIDGTGYFIDSAIIFDVIPPGAGVEGDLDDDGDVDFSDLLALLATWGECPLKGDCPADLDDSGDVGFADLLVLLANWSAT